MKYFFWQNILSIHQSSFIRNLAETNEVILIVEEGLDEERVSHGWNIPDFGKALVVINPDDEKISKYLKDKNSINIFTGINSFPMVYKVFKKAVKNNMKVLVYMEPYNWVDSKAWIRLLKYRLLFFKYKNKIDGILAISSAARKCYETAGFAKKKVFDWAYFTENSQTDKVFKSDEYGVRLLYIGSVDERKNIMGVLPIIRKLSAHFLKFNIIGRGPLEHDLSKFTDSHNIEYLGAVPNKYIRTYLLNSDILILPSMFDGWGAVINEALLSGTKVLCSENCGASDLIRENRGYIFSYNPFNFEEQFLKLLKEGNVTNVQRAEIANWAEKNISGKAAADYFQKIVKHIYYNEIRPIAPWL